MRNFHEIMETMRLFQSYTFVTRWCDSNYTVIKNNQTIGQSFLTCSSNSSLFFDLFLTAVL